LRENDLNLIRDAALESGKIAMRFFCQDLDQWDKGGGQGPVSEADLAIDQMLQSEFASSRPSYCCLSEETEDNLVRCESDTVFIIDPIDGTRSFLNGHKNFATSIAIARKGVVTEAVIYVPAKELLFEAQLGKGSKLNGELIKTGARNQVKGARVLASGSQSNPKLWQDKAPPFERHFRSSLAYRLCLVAQGRFDGMMTLRPTWEWDVAAGDLICTEAGCDVLTQDKTKPVYNAKKPIMNGMIAGNPAMAAGLMSYL
jgi:myo-inositol-1(or 4)-monophosphatase